MGNNRQQLKDKIAKDLKEKVQEAQNLLSALKTAQETVERDSAEAKYEVKVKVELLTQLLASRKFHLTRQIDVLSQTQINNLQENVQSTYLLLGSLRSTLSNLDSFDNGQLIHLQIPDAAPHQPTSLPSALEVRVECDQLKADIEALGSVSAKGFRGLIDVGTSASMPKSYVDYTDPSNDFVFMSHKPVDSLSENNARVTPIMSTASPLLTNESGSQTTSRIPNESGTVGKWNIEKWLYEVKSQRCPENEDFEMLTIEAETAAAVEENMRQAPARLNQPVCQDSLVPDVDNVEGTQLETTDDGENSSIVSIVCIDHDQVEEENELSKWLKPRKRLCHPNSTPKPSILGPIPVEIMQPPRIVTSTASSKSRFLDYPGLRLDPKCWLQKKKSKGQLDDLFKLSAEVSMTLNQKEIIPPTYALPYPFWLKKC